MPSFRDLLPAERPPEELEPRRHARIQGETVEEALARGVRIQVLPILHRDLDEDTAQRPRWGNDGFLGQRARRRRKPLEQAS